MSLQVRRLASTVLAQLPPSFRSSRQPRVVGPTSGFLTYFSAFLPTGLCMRALAQTRIAWHSCVVPGQAFERDQAGCKCRRNHCEALADVWVLLELARKLQHAIAAAVGDLSSFSCRIEFELVARFACAKQNCHALHDVRAYQHPMQM